MRQFDDTDNGKRKGRETFAEIMKVIWNLEHELPAVLTPTEAEIHDTVLRGETLQQTLSALQAIDDVELIEDVTESTICVDSSAGSATTTAA